MVECKKGNCKICNAGWREFVECEEPDCVFETDEDDTAAIRHIAGQS